MCEIYTYACKFHWKFNTSIVHTFWRFMGKTWVCVNVKKKIYKLLTGFCKMKNCKKLKKVDESKKKCQEYRCTDKFVQNQRISAVRVFPSSHFLIRCNGHGYGTSVTLTLVVITRRKRVSISCFIHTCMYIDHLKKKEKRVSGYCN